MSESVPWSSQPLDEWALKYAPGRILNLDGLPTHYLEQGQGDPLILLHGFFFDINMWQNNIEALAQRYRVLAMDLWGFGYSTREPLEYGYELYARQLSLFMKAMNIPRAHLMGQSMGGGTIIKFAAENPEKVNKLVLVDPAGMPNPLPIMGRISNLPGLGELMYLMPGNFVRRFTLGSTFMHRKELLSDELFQSLTRFHKIEDSHRVMLKITRTQFFDTLQETIKKLGQLDLPIMIVWGRNEKSIPLAVGQQLHQIVKGSRLEILDQAGHCPNLDQPQQFNQLALDFLQTLPG